MAALSLFIFSAAVTDLLFARIYNIQIIFAFAAGAALSIYHGSLAGFIARTLFTGAALYYFFYIRALGAGDVKLMAIIVGFLGVMPGLTVLFSGLVISVISFIFSCAASGILTPKKKIKLAPSIFGGYVLWRMGLFASITF